MLRVDFYVNSISDVVGWEALARALERKGASVRWVVEPPGRNRAGGIVNDAYVSPIRPSAIEEITLVLESMGYTTHFRGRYQEADAVVTNGAAAWLSEWDGLEIRTQYASDAMELGDEELRYYYTSDLDAILTIGPLMTQDMLRIVERDKIHEVGFPKYGPYFRDGIDVDAWRRHWNLDPSKPTIAYFSTWMSKTRIEQFSPAVAALGERYNVLYKPHGLIRLYQPERYDTLRNRRGVIVGDDVHSIIPFIAVADLVIADTHSGSFSEPMLLDKPVVGLTWTGSRDTDHMREAAYDAAHFCYDPSDLEALVVDALDNDPHREGRRAFAGQLFSDMGGHDDDLAADAIAAVVEQRGGPRDRSTSEPDHHTSEPDISVVVTGDVKRGELLQCLDALARQALDRSKFEVFVAAGRWSFDFDQQHLRSYPYNAQLVLGDTVTEARHAAVEQAASPVVLLLDGDSLAEPNLLHDHLTHHTDDRPTVVVGPSTSSALEPRRILTHVLEVTTLVRPFAGLTPGPITDATQVPTGNISMPRETLRAAGSFALELPDDVQHLALAHRLLTGKANIVHDPTLRCTHVHEVDIHHLRMQTINHGAALVDLLAADPSTLALSSMASFSNDTVATLQSAIDDEHHAVSDWVLGLTDLADVRIGRLVGFGQGPSVTAQGIAEITAALLQHLLLHWKRKGLLEGLRAHDSSSFAELCERAIAELPWPLATRSNERYLAWPDYENDVELERLMSFVPTLAERNACLCLRHDTAVDPPYEVVMKRLEDAFEGHVDNAIELELLVVDDEIPAEGRSRLGRAISAALSTGANLSPGTAKSTGANLSPGTADERQQFLDGLGARMVREPNEISSVAPPEA